MRTFAEKRLEFHLFLTPDSENTDPDKQELRWEGSFCIDLNKLFFSGSTIGDDKFDIFVPVTTQTMGNLIAKISVSVAMSPFYPDDVHALRLHKENDIFWPPSSYVDHDVLPDAWLSMMTGSIASSNRDRNHSKKVVSTEKFNSYIIDSIELSRYVAFCKSIFEKEFVMSDGTANCSDVLHMIRMECERIAKSEMQLLLMTAEQMLEDDVRLPTRLRFDDLMLKIIYEMEHCQQDQNSANSFSNGNENSTNMTGHHLKSTRRDVTRLSNRLSATVGISFQKALSHLYVPRFENIDEMPNAYLDARTQRKMEEENLLSFDEHNEGKCSESDDEMEHDERVIDAYLNHQSRASRRASKMATNTYKHALEDLHLGKSKCDSNTTLLELSKCTPSRSRRHRRGLVLLTIFESVSKHGDMMDVAELRQYLEEQKKKLGDMLRLVSTTGMRLPVVKYRFDLHLRDNFSFLRSVICCLLLDSCRALKEKFVEYDSNGIGSITELGFLTLCESFFREISVATTENAYSVTILELKRHGEDDYVHAYESQKINSEFRMSSKNEKDLLAIVEGKEGHGGQEYDFECDERDDITEYPESEAAVHKRAVDKHLSKRSTTILRSTQDEAETVLKRKRVLQEAKFDDTPVAIWQVYLREICVSHCTMH